MTAVGAMTACTSLTIAAIEQVEGDSLKYRYE
jgi:hypothetical protein